MKGSLLASGNYDENGNLVDNENLRVSTKSLTFQNSSNTVYNTSNSFNIAANIGIGKTSKDSTSDSKDGTKVNSSSVQYPNNKTYSKTKTLATLGKGEITITDEENSDDIDSLNRDTENAKKDIYDVSTGVKIDMTLDHRLLTEDGRNQIKEDFVKSSFITKALLEAATTKSTTLVGDKSSGVTGLFQNIEDKVALFEGTKKFVNDPTNKEIRDILLDPNANPKEVKIAQQQLHVYVAKEMGITPAQLEIMLDKQYKGFTSSENGKSRIAGNLHNNMGDLANTTLNETSDVADLQRDKDVVKNDNYVGNRAEYSKNFGGLGQDLLDNQYSENTGTTITKVNYNKKGTNLNKPNELDKTVVTNTQNFNTLDKSKGAHRQLKTEEIKVIEDNANNYAKIKYNTSNPTSEQIQGAKHELAQEALRQTDLIWNLVLGEENSQAKNFLTTVSKDKSFTNSRGEKQALFTTKNTDFFDPSKYANESVKTNTDLYKVAQEQAKEILSNKEELTQRIKENITANAKEYLENLPKELVNSMEETKEKDFIEYATEIVRDNIISTATTIVNGIETAENLDNTSSETIDKVYGNHTSVAIKDISTVLAFGAVVGKSKGKKTIEGASDLAINNSNIGYKPLPKITKTSSSSTIFGELDNLGRPTGVTATITEDMLGTGSKANQNIKPPGFIHGDENHARGHLLANVLGGSGKDNKNLVTLYQRSVNTPTMRSFETKVQKAVKNGEIVNYRVVPIYTGNNAMPTGITMSAIGSNGFTLDISIPNVNGAINQ